MTDHRGQREERVDPPLELDDDQALKEYGRQLAMDSLIGDLQSDDENLPQIAPLPAASWGRRAWIGISAASVAGLAGFAFWKWRQGGGQVSPHLASLDPRWVLQAVGAADYRVLAPGHVRLLRGELRLTSSAPAELVVETPAARATASSTDFLIAHYDPAPLNTTPRAPQTMKTNPMTRLLVVAGSVTLANGEGAETARADEAIIARTDGPPEKIVVDANTQFAFDCYAALADAAGDTNLSFSPYSISNALLMVAEGARGETAEQMGRVLGFPEPLQRTGADAQRIPWEMSKIRAGQSQLMASLNAVAAGAESPEQVELREREAAMLEQWDELKAKIAVVPADDHQGRFRLEDDERILVHHLNELRGKMDTLRLRVANAVWGERTMHLLEPWRQTVAGSYGAGAVEEADFINNLETERGRINAWVEKQTSGRITDLFPARSLAPDTRLVLANAIYLKGDWMEPFPKERTVEADFSLPSGGRAKVQLMRKDKDQTARYAAFNADGSPFDTPEFDFGEGKPKYPARDGFSMVELPYRGGSVSMVVIAPNDPAGLPAIEEKLGADMVTGWIARLERRKTNVRLPRFKLETSYDLEETLATMGMPSAFVPGRADFTGISASGQIFIGGVAHKAFIEVTEEGTEAAAASGIRVAKSVEPFIPTFNADRPFVYLIRERQSGTIMFLGRVISPQP